MTRTPSVVESKISARNGSGAAKLFGERGLDQERLDSIRASLPDRPFMMKDVSWEDYQALTTILEEPAIRATYDRGYLELRMPLFIHEKIAAILSLMVHILCVEWDIDIAHARSTTFRRADLGKGVEPDN